MPEARNRAVRIIVAAIAASLLLSAACCAMAVLNISGYLTAELRGEPQDAAYCVVMQDGMTN